MGTPQSLRVLLHEVDIGTMSIGSHEMVEFRLLESYKQAYPRPVLGQTFLDDLSLVRRSRARVPAWFSNLLPEGILRELIARQAGVATSREYFLLTHLGDDLPGAVRIVASDDKDLVEADLDEKDTALQISDVDWHFSLAGVQLKFSAQRLGKGLTIPVAGKGGDWIVKLPDSRFPAVPANEFATMSWARASGIDVPDFELIPLSAIEGLPRAVNSTQEHEAFAIRRFDRPSRGQRLHMEDFAQVLDLYPEQKYQRANYETLAKLTASLTGEQGLRELVLRLVFMLASGNGDAHLKNWSLLYPDGITPQLSPAYDLVSTIQYMPQDGLALNLGKSKRWEDMDLEVFIRLSRRIDFPENRLLEMVQASIASVLDAWHQHQEEFGFGAAARLQLTAHMQGVPLLKG
jgi:serine/threonine-protein kinase HipA